MQLLRKEEKTHEEEESAHLACFGWNRFLLLIVGVPILINELYKKNSGYITMREAADVLNYYGMIKSLNSRNGKL